MKTDIKICGNCGNNLDDNLDPTGKTVNDFNWDDLNLNQVLYQCNDCRYYEEQQDRMVQVTRDMATDAGDPSLEGQWIQW